MTRWRTSEQLLYSTPPHHVLLVAAFCLKMEAAHLSTWTDILSHGMPGSLACQAPSRSRYVRKL